MCLKIFAKGFLFNDGAYLRDPWNILDFIIIVIGYVTNSMDASALVKLSALRSLRILRPLRTINNIKALRDIIQALFSSVKLLINSLVILVFF
jgi:hypothetical protein